MLKLALVTVGFALAVLGVMAKTTHEEPKRIVKRPTLAGWVLLVLLTTSLALSVAVERIDQRERAAGTARDRLWQMADARLKLLNWDVKAPLCAFISDVSRGHNVIDGLESNFNKLLFGDASGPAEDIVGFFDLKCSPGGDWMVVGMFRKDRPSEPCFSSFNKICNARATLSDVDGLRQIRIMDKWDEPINAAGWMSGFAIGETVARLTYHRRPGVSAPELGDYWRNLFGAAAELLFVVDAQAGLWIRVPLRLDEVQNDDTEIRMTWSVADAPTIALVQ